jgi:hypothetical protein
MFRADKSVSRTRPALTSSAATFSIARIEIST